MRPTFAIAIMVLCPTAPVLAKPIDKAVLQKVARLPSLYCMDGIVFNSRRGFRLEGEEIDCRKELETLQRSLRGTPEDAARYLEIGGAHVGLDDKASARVAHEKARQLFEEQLRADPQCSAARRGLADALERLHLDAEAHTILIEAVHADPNNWENRVALGQFYTDQASLGLMRGRGNIDINDLIATGARAELDEARRDAIMRFLDAGSTCHDEAVRLAPNVAGAYTARAESRGHQGLIRTAVNVLTGNHSGNPMVVELSPDRSDLRKAAELQPDNYRLFGYLTLLELTALHADRFDEAKANELLRGACVLLDAAMRNPNPVEAANATQVLAFMYVIAGQDNPACDHYRRAVTLNPKRDITWEMLTCCLWTTKKHDDMVDVARRRIEIKDSPRARVSLAKGYEALNQLDKAEAEIRAALKLDADDLLANLSMAVLLIKTLTAVEQSKDLHTASLEQAAVHLDRVAAKLTDSSKEIDDYRLTRGIVRALQGDREGARQLIQDVLLNDPENSDARLVLAELVE